MRIALVAPLYESVPPARYGGTERVVSALTEELVRQGHDVTLFASGDSHTRAQLVAPVPSALRLGGLDTNPVAGHLVLFEALWRRAGSFDVVHFHTDALHLPMARRLPVPTVTTTHNRLDLPELRLMYREFDDLPLVSISDSQQRALPGAGWVATVHHGLPTEHLPLRTRDDGYLAFLGRISPEKGVEAAIRIARRAGLPLRIAAKVGDGDRAWFEHVIRPQIQPPAVEFLGEIDEAQKGAFLGGARALLFPIDWPEPFGLVLIEAMACGTPVVAYPNGSVPELIDDGVTGFLVGGEREAARALGQVGRLDRAGCRREFERRFGVGRMAGRYLDIYAAVAGVRRAALAEAHA